MNFDDDERRARIGARHHLHPSRRTHSVAEIADTLVGIHSSDPATVYLSARARLVEPSIESIDDQLYETRTVARVLGMRRTLFVVPIDLVPALHRVASMKYAEGEANRLARWIEEAGIADDGGGWVARVKAATVAAVDQLGPAAAAELSELVPELTERIEFGQGKRWAGTVGVSTRILFLLATEGTLVRARPRGSWLSGQYRWELRDRWIGPQPTLAAEAARAQLLEAWLGTYGPGSMKDLRWWSGWTKHNVERALDTLDARETSIGGQPLFYLPGDVETTPTGSWVALLPSLDSTTMGWKERGWYVGDRADVLFDRNGNAGATIWADGRIVGMWAQRSDGTVVHQTFERLGAAAEVLLEEEKRALASFVGDSVVKPRFRTPFERTLAE